MGQGRHTLRSISESCESTILTLSHRTLPSCVAPLLILACVLVAERPAVFDGDPRRSSGPSYEVCVYQQIRRQSASSSRHHTPKPNCECRAIFSTSSSVVLK